MENYASLELAVKTGYHVVCILTVQSIKYVLRVIVQMLSAGRTLSGLISFDSKQLNVHKEESEGRSPQL